MENLIIIGTGPAGLTAAIYTARANLNPLVIEGFQPGGQLTTTTEIENYPGFPQGIDGTTLTLQMRQQAERFGARFHPGEVLSSSLTCLPHSLTLATGEKMEAKAIIIATGASAQYLGIESEQKLIGRGVSGCATCDGSFYRDLPVAVVGGGDTAIEEALFLTRFASKITLIHRRGQLRASKIMVDRLLAHPKIEILFDSVVEEVLDVEKNEVNGLKLRHVKTNRTSELAVNGLFIAIGHKPNTRPFAQQLDTDHSGYLITKNTRTNIAGIFAAGDVQDSLYRQAITAAGSGCMAAIEAERFLAAQS